MTAFKSLLPTELDRAAFVQHFGGVYEHCPWIAEQVWDSGLDAGHNSLEGLQTALRAFVENAGYEPQLALLRAHPDLAGTLAVSGNLTEESTNEQASAGLNACTQEEFETFQNLNAAYREKFGFPYILAVKGRKRAEILENFKSRVAFDPFDEFTEALSQVHQIAFLRLSEL